ncbi:efflux RND transporter periplasmic adaptor subunit [Clostridium peptidivorans]|uniref:efflux RND transporter periplasmic adaptor subunit n=1 Tax=Clostridium peptidivorans TaxID=100174 RepID=UPI000BE2934A|nr:efflux RND transporter periplasmic adaptor subunit [Clostridium peptidivorans]
MEKMKLRGILLTLSAIIVLTGCSKGKANNKATENVEVNLTPVQVALVKKDTIKDITMISGKVIPTQEVAVSPKLGGKVTDIRVKVGDKVNKGDILFALDDSDAQARVDQAQSGVQSSQAAIEQAQSGVASAKAAYDTAKANYEASLEKIQNAKVNLERMKVLYEEGIISKSQYEQAQLAASDSSLEVLKSQLAQAEAAYKQPQASQKQAQAAMGQSAASYKQAVQALEDTVVRAPIDGFVTALNIEVGEMSSNMQAPITISNLNKVYVKINVTENLINKIKSGDKVTANFSALNNKEFIGTISTITPAANSTTQLFDVNIEIDNKDNEIKSGMFANIKLSTNTKKNALIVKSEAVLQKEDKNIVYIVKDNKTMEKQVSIGIDNGDFAEITSGLSQGDKVVIKGQHYVENDEKVKVVEGVK